jgi:hypothetical protein
MLIILALHDMHKGGSTFFFTFKVENSWIDLDMNANPLEATTYSYISVGITDFLDLVLCLVF